jgi:hypothetical protein
LVPGRQRSQENAPADNFQRPKKPLGVKTIHYESHNLKTGERKQHEYTKLSEDEDDDEVDNNDDEDEDDESYESFDEQSTIVVDSESERKKLST